MQTRAPSSRKRAAVAAPMPLAPPVTRTFLPFSPRTPAPSPASSSRGFLVLHGRLLPKQADELAHPGRVVGPRARGNHGTVDDGVGIYVFSAGGANVRLE